MKWTQVIAGIIFILLVARIIHARRKYGSLKLFRKKIALESQKPLEQVQAELQQEPHLFEQALEIIKKHQGNMYQEQLRKEMNYPSEAKINLILAELERRGSIKQVKKIWGKMVVLK